MKSSKGRPIKWRSLSRLLFLGMLGWAAEAAFGDEITWLGTASVAFTNPPNWQESKVPLNTSASTGDVAVFGATFTPYQPELTANRAIYGLKFLKSDGGWTLDGPTRVLTLGTYGIDDTTNESGVTTIRPRVIFSSGQNTVPFATGQGGRLYLEGGLTNTVNMVLVIPSGTVIVSRIDADSPSRTFLKRGQGTLVLTNAAGPSQQGAFVLSAGRLVLGHPHALGRGQFRVVSSGIPAVIEPLLPLTDANAITNNVQWGNTNVVEGPFSVTFTGTLSGPSSGNLVGFSNNLAKGCRLLFSGPVLISESNNPTKNAAFIISGPGETEFSGNMSNGDSDRRGSLVVAHPLDGLTILSGANTYTGDTTVAGGVLLLKSAEALPGGIASTGGLSALNLAGGILGLGFGDFQRPVTNVGGNRAAVRFTSAGGGFAAFDADRTVNLGGASQPVTWGADFVPNNAPLILGAPAANRTVFFANPIVLSTSQTATNRTFIVYDGEAEVDGVLQGVLSHGTGACRLDKQGNGTLALTALNTYTGGTWVQEGELRVQGTAGSGDVVVFSGAAISGTGQVASLTLQNNGHLKPYDNGAGVPSHLTVTGVFSIASGTLDLSGISNAPPGSWPLVTAGSIVGETFANVIPGPPGRTVQIISNQIILRPLSPGALIQIR